MSQSITTSKMCTINLMRRLYYAHIDVAINIIYNAKSELDISYACGFIDSARSLALNVDVTSTDTMPLNFFLNQRNKEIQTQGGAK